MNGEGEEPRTHEKRWGVEFNGDVPSMSSGAAQTGIIKSLKREVDI